MHRICIYPQDVVWITGRSETYARDLLRDIKLLHHKQSHQLVTIEEFCTYTGLPFEGVFNMINNIKPTTTNSE